MRHGFLIDMDGVIYRGGQLIPGAVEFIAQLQNSETPFAFLTNNSQRTRRDVATKLERMGIDVDERHVFTCAMATARFLAQQLPEGTAYVIGEGGLLRGREVAGVERGDEVPAGRGAEHEPFEGAAGDVALEERDGPGGFNAGACERLGAAPLAAGAGRVEGSTERAPYAPGERRCFDHDIAGAGGGVGSVAGATAAVVASGLGAALDADAARTSIVPVISGWNVHAKA